MPKANREGRQGFAQQMPSATTINKGTNGRWKDLLTEDELQMYREAMARTLEPACACWLENGGAVEQD